MSIDAAEAAIIFQERCSLPLLGRGTYNSNYLIERGSDRMVLRVPRSTLGTYDPRALDESEVLHFLERASWPHAPKLIFRSLNPEFLVLSFVDGEQFRPDRNSGHELMTMIDSLHRLSIEDTPLTSVSGVENLTLTSLKRFARAQISQYSHDADWTRLCQQDVDLLLLESQTLLSSARRSVLLHGDITAANVIAASSGLALIDFEGALFGDPLYDYAIAFTRIDWPSGMLEMVRCLYLQNFSVKNGETARDLMSYMVVDLVRAKYNIRAKYLNRSSALYDPVVWEDKNASIVRRIGELRTAL